MLKSLRSFAAPLAVAVVLFAAVALMPGLRVKAQSGCTAGTLSGPYGFAIQGYYFDPSFNYGMYAAAGRVVFNGAGAISGTVSESYSGQILRSHPLVGDYVVNADCTGTARLVSKEYNSLSNFDFVITGGGKEVQFIQMDQGMVISGPAKQQ
jgi:hypothetical protein